MMLSPQLSQLSQLSPRLSKLPALSLLLACMCLPPRATSAGPAEAAPRYKTSMPPSADLSYSVKARQGNLDISGNSTVDWQVSGGKYSIVSETRAMLVGKILDEKSEGVIDQYGLAPVTFTEKRLRKSATTVSFNRQTHTISFTGSARTYPIHGGEQDRVSIAWQLIGVARAAPAKVKPGATWHFLVVGQQDADPWTFKVVGQEKIRTPMGDMPAVHIARDTGPDNKGRQLDIWLAPSLEWYPVRLRFTENDGDSIEQMLEKIDRK